MDKPLFTDLYTALRWAWYGSVVAAETVGGASYVQLQSRDKRDRDEDIEPPPAWNPDIGGKPRGYDAGAQAAFIKAEVAKLPAAEFYHVIAKFLVGPERVAAREALQPLVLDLMQVTGRDREAVALLLARFYGKRRLTINSISKRVKPTGGRRRVTALNVSLLAEMDAISVRAEKTLYYALQRMGVVQ